MNWNNLRKSQGIVIFNTIGSFCFHAPWNLIQYITVKLGLHSHGSSTLKAVVELHDCRKQIHTLESFDKWYSRASEFFRVPLQSWEIMLKMSFRSRLTFRPYMANPFTWKRAVIESLQLQFHWHLLGQLSWWCSVGFGICPMDKARMDNMSSSTIQ